MTNAGAISDEQIRGLIEGALPGAQILRITPLRADRVVPGATRKAVGYGCPLRIDVTVAGANRSVVLHTATSNAFGHDRRADRAADALLLSDACSSIDQHVPVLDVGAFRGDSGSVSLRNAGEFYVLTEWAEGTPYANDLRRMSDLGVASSQDVERCESLATYLARLHGNALDRPYAYRRAWRDLLGSGEGIFGIVDGYPEDAPVARLKRIESLCLEWRWRTKGVARPLVRTHGDFHPFNVLFDACNELVLLDTSRGSCGDAADDVTCLAINYVFFALDRPASWKSVFAALWETFWRTYLRDSEDKGVLDVAAPFLAWRGLVLANPVWYPALSPEARASLLAFVEAALEMPRFDPSLAGRIFE